LLCGRRVAQPRPRAGAFRFSAGCCRNSRRCPPRQSPRDAFPGPRSSGPGQDGKQFLSRLPRGSPGDDPLPTLTAILIAIFALEVASLADG
jgi:hypothetical protein